VPPPLIATTACLPALLPACPPARLPADFVDSNRRETEQWRRQFRAAALLTLPVFISEWQNSASSSFSWVT
jgi:hypothetical protein